tara:strand:+ start:5525 stop:6145 length:621 start_codon:yes stop_codon:yes gene_type:complete
MDTHQLFYLHFLCKSNNSTKIHKKIKPLLNLNNNFDKLFFNFLIVIKYPNIDINYNKNIEKMIKYNIAQNLEKLKFKQLNNVINNLCYEDNISLYTLSALCKYYKLNFFYINENITHNMFYNEEIDYYYLVNNNKDIKYTKKENFIKMCKDLYNIENIQKPLNSVTYYKLNELEDIYNNLNLENNKNYKKKELYEYIKNYIDSLLL